VQRESGEVVDRFRNRLMVPICRDTGSVIAFGGRQMDADQGGPKYLKLARKRRFTRRAGRSMA
jgi:DNA primase